MKQRDTRICPICQRKGLLVSDGNDRIKWSRIQCHNENYTHWSMAGRHFLSRTLLNVKEEIGDSIPQLVLN